MKHRPEFPEMIDSSMLSYFKSCPRKFFYSYMLHLKPNTESHHLLAGHAFASGLEAARNAFYGEGKPVDEAIVIGAVALIQDWGDFQTPDGKKKQLDVMLGAYMDYFIEYPMDRDHLQPLYYADNRPAIEFTFAIPLPVNHPETGQPLLYVGRCDMVGVHQSTGFNYAVDEKTAEQLGPWWVQQWDLRSQFTGYTWACNEHGIPVKGAVVRGIGIMAAEYKYAEVISTRPKWMIDEWYTQMIRDLERLKLMWADGHFDADFGDACAAYGGCPFRGACTTTPQNREVVLDMDFTPRKWNPVEHLEEEIND